MSPVAIRPSRAGDDAALAALNVATWAPEISPGPRPAPDAPFFGEGRRPEDVLVAVDGGALAGYVLLGRPTPLASNDHVATINGLTVDPAHRRRGIARLLLAAAVEAARERGARRLTLRVLGANAPARALYQAAGFIVEGVLREEFRLGGRYVDDVLMARDLAPAEPLGDR